MPNREPRPEPEQTAAIHFALVTLLLEATDGPFQPTIGWCVRHGKSIFEHGEDGLRRFLTEKVDAWMREAMPFHL